MKENLIHELNIPSPTYQLTSSLPDDLEASPLTLVPMSYLQYSWEGIGNKQLHRVCPFVVLLWELYSMFIMSPV